MCQVLLYNIIKLDPKNTELLSQKQKLLASAIGDTKTKLDTLKTASEQAAKTAGNYDAWKAKYDPLKKKIGETETKLSDLKEQSKKADEQLSKGEISQEKYNALQKEIADTETELKDLKKAAEDVDNEFGKPISPQQYDALQREIIETEQELQNLQREADKSKSALEKIGEAGTKMQDVGDKISSAGKKLLPLTAGIAAVGTIAVKTTADFDEAMSKVSAVSGATGDDLEALRAKAREMGATTKFSASDAAEALNYMAMAGWKTNDMLNGIEGIMNLAAASGEDLATTSDIVTDALTALGMSADDSAHFADVLAAASSNANTNVSINGIRYMLGSLINTVVDVANSIREYLHFSVPDRGPLTDFKSWMPDFMKGLADGINKSKKLVIKAIEGVSEAMQLTLNTDVRYNLDGTSAALIDGSPDRPTTVNNYYTDDHSKTVNQTNNSPKALSRLEIYRQTRNAVKE